MLDGFMKSFVKSLLSYNFTEEANGPSSRFVIMSLAVTSLKGRLETQIDPHSESKLYKTRHMISKYHLKLLKNNNVDGEHLKTSCLTASFLTCYLLLPSSPHSSLFPFTFSSLCFGDSGDFTLLKGVCCFAKCCTCIIIKPLDKYRSSTFLLLLFQRLCSHA